MPGTRAEMAGSALARVMRSVLAIRDAGSDAGLHDAALRSLDVNWDSLHLAGWECADDIADLERELQFDREGGVRQLRNRHVMLRTCRDLPRDEALAAMARDPGLAVFSFWGDGTMASLVRRDAGCAACGRSFELDAHGEPLRNAPGDQLALFGGERLRGRGAAFGRSGCDLPAGRVTCPRCGWAAPFAWRAEELMLTCTWPLVHVRPSTAPLEWVTRTLGLSYGVAPGPFELEMDLAGGDAWLSGEPVPDGGLPREVAASLDEYPVVPAVMGALRKQQLDPACVFPGPVRSVDDLVAAARRG